LNEEDARKFLLTSSTSGYVSTLERRNHQLHGFLGQIASFMGLKTPFHLQKPESYVNELREMNGGRQTVQLAND